MAVEGRWTLRVCACTVASVLDRGPALPTPCERERNISLIPVVPCDDDAVKRATLAIYERLNPPSSPPVIYSATWYHETAEALLRAAGGHRG